MIFLHLPHDFPSPLLGAWPFNAQPRRQINTSLYLIDNMNRGLEHP
jgi:hypothetical protein